MYGCARPREESASSTQNARIWDSVHQFTAAARGSAARTAQRRRDIRPVHSCFNGAGMFPSRKSELVSLDYLLVSELQWGRDVCIPEILPVAGAKVPQRSL